ncbi:glycoside hydrolase family 2 TIM barrel-domain containing protein [Actinoplanes sp. NPDC000266]
MRRHLSMCVVGTLLAALGAVGIAGPASAADPPADVHDYLEDPRRVQENQESPHAALRPYPDVAAARAGGTGSPWIRSLDGTWRLAMADRPADVPAGFQREGYDVSDWRRVTVPHTWQSDGLDHPLFRNLVTEMVPDAPPAIPRDVNPTGAYVRTFDVPRSWDGRRTFVRFEGVTSAYFLWVNGRYVGYDQGGYTPAEFDLTDVVRPGHNTIALQVHRWSAGTHLENYDQWRFSGIFRTTWLYSTPSTYLRDVTITTPGGSHLRAVVDVAAKGGPAGAHTVRGRLYDPKGRPVTTTTGSVAPATGTVTLDAAVADPLPWTDETPNLYALVVELLDPTGRVTHVTRQPVGLRTIEVSDKQLKVNGKRILVRGVNHSDADPDGGRHVPRARLEQDVDLLKQHNVNAIRTAHYPSDPYLYELADTHGLWIDDEVEVETHHHDNCPSNCLADRPEWKDAFLDRFIGMVQRDKNHPSVLMWDTGNEAGLGAAHYAMAEWADRNEPTRPLYHQSNSPDGDAPFADVWGPRYPSPSSLEEKAKTTEKPIVMGEYVHAQGNSLGNFREFWDVMRKYPSAQGGFIWDWVDQQLRQPLRIVPDRSGHDIQAWINGLPDTVPGPRGGDALALSGLDDFVEVYRAPVLDEVSRGLTLDAWVKPARPWTGDLTIVAKGDHQYAIKMKSETQLEFFVYGDGAYHVVQATVPADWYEKWHRVAGTFDGDVLRLHIDGAVVGETRWTGAVDRSAWPVNIGRNAESMRENINNSRMAHGAVDDVRVYHRALSTAELADPSVQADPVLALDFEDIETRGTYLSYGAGEAGNDGMISPDRVPQPEATALNAVHAPVRFAFAGRTLSVTNERAFTGTSDVQVRWQYVEGDRVLRSGTHTADVAPGGTARLELPAPPANPRDAERHLTVRAVLARPTGWAPAGHVVAVEQFPLGGDQVPGVFAPEVPGAVTTRTTADSVVLTGPGFVYTVDRRSGTLTSMKVRGTELLTGGPELDVWRPPVSNDVDEARAWRAVGLDRLATTVTGVGTSGSTVTIGSRVAAPGVTDAGFDQEISYAVAANGDVRVSHRVTPQGRMRDLPMLPRVGLQMRLPSALDTFVWHGRGPGETYPDRVDGSPVGVWRSTVDKQYVEYSAPQEYGNHEDVRWAALSDGRSSGLLVAGDLSVGVTPFTGIDRAQYPHALQRTPGELTLRADHAVSGVAETFHSVLPQYRVAADREYAYQVLLRPLSRAEAIAGRPNGPATCAPEARLSAGTGSWEPGASATMTLTVHNPCAGTMRELDAVVRVPAGWSAGPVTIGALAAGATATREIRVGEFAVAAELTGVGAGNARVYARTAEVVVTAAPAPPSGDTALADAELLRARNGWGPVERDASNGEDAAGDGSPLRIGGVTYERGLGVHADSSMVVHLGGRCSSFTAVTGVDDEVGDGGSVVFEVWADGERIWAGARLTGADGPVPVDLPLTGRDRVELRVSDASDGNALDHADWADAVLHCAV